MKKWPWKEEMRRPLEQRMRMTASQAVGRDRLCRTSCASLGPSRLALKAGREYSWPQVYLGSVASDARSMYTAGIPCPLAALQSHSHTGWLFKNLVTSSVASRGADPTQIAA